MRAFAQEHGVNPRTMFDHVTKGIAGDRIEVIERPKPNRPRETERLLTPAMQEQAIAFWQRHNVVYTPCSVCPHTQDVDNKSAPVDASKKETERFYVEDAGGSWAVRDSEIWPVMPKGMKPQPLLVQWHTKEQDARNHAQELNRTRGHAVDEPKCIECGAQPAGGDGPRCAYHHSRLADMHG
jgi:Zn ribbon nucleic-acid-binding protein